MLLELSFRKREEMPKQEKNSFAEFNLQMQQNSD